VKFHHIRDPVHKHISIPEQGVISDLIDTLEFQRLRYIRQLGVTYQTYPGGEHSRFFHSLGVSHVAGRMYDVVAGDDGKEEERTKLQIAALLHDLGHSPFSHLLERFFTPSVPHEEWGQRIILDGSTDVGERVRKSTYTPQEVASLIGKGPSRPRYLRLMVSSQMDADRFDYLIRDAYYTGAPYGNFDIERIMHTIRAGKDDSIRVLEKGMHSVEGYLMSRYYMYNQVYLHRTTLCFEFLLKSMLTRASDLLNSGANPAPRVPMFGDVPMGTQMKLDPIQYSSVTDSEVLSCIREWTRSPDRVLGDLSKRFVRRRPIFKPVKDLTADHQTLWEKKGKIEALLASRDLPPQYYLSVVMRAEKEGYTPYGPQKEDQENAILLDDGREISDVLPGLKALAIGPPTLLCVPEECRDDIAGMLK